MYRANWTPLITVFQKKPFFLVHRHLIRLFPTATFPSSQTTIHVAPWHAVPATPDGRSNSGQRFHSAAALIPTGCPHRPSDLVRYISIASLYVGCTHSDAFAPMAIYWKSFNNANRYLSMPDGQALTLNDRSLERVDLKRLVCQYQHFSFISWSLSEIILSGMILVLQLWCRIWIWHLKNFALISAHWQNSVRMTFFECHLIHKIE